jgi:hypothetical protein
MHSNTQIVKSLFEKKLGRKVTKVWTQTTSFQPAEDDPDATAVNEERVVVDFDDRTSIVIVVRVAEHGASVSGFLEYQ